MGSGVGGEEASATVKRNTEAEEVYRAAWNQYALTSDEETRRALEKVMDEAQVKIAVGPTDPRWRVFIETLPGYREFWARFKAECDEKIREMKGRGQ